MHPPEANPAAGRRERRAARERVRRRRTVAAVLVGATTVGLASGAALAIPGASVAQSSEQRPGRSAAPLDLYQADITAAAGIGWTAVDGADVAVVPLRDQPEQIALATDLAAEPELVTATETVLRAAPRDDAEVLAVLAEGVGLGADSPTHVDGGFTRVYTTEGNTGYVVSDTVTPQVERQIIADDAAEPAAGDGGLVAIARSQVGSAYVYAGNTPGGFDCSGLVTWTYAQTGRFLPRSSGVIRAAGTVIPASEAQPGDVIWSPGHVSIYAGGDQQIEAIGVGSGVQQTRIWQDSPVFLRF